MSDIKNLIKAKSHDPYREFEIVSYLTCFETAHKEFFKFMAEKGYELYKNIIKPLDRARYPELRYFGTKIMKK